MNTITLEFKPIHKTVMAAINNGHQTDQAISDYLLRAGYSTAYASEDNIRRICAELEAMDLIEDA